MGILDFEDFYIKCSNSELDEDMLRSAFQYAAAKHSGQVRKTSNLPYLVHPIGVALSLKEFDQDVIIAGLLHDVLEDTDATEEEILEKFGPVVLNLVSGMTKNRETKDIFKSLEEAAQNDKRVYIIKLADRLDNLRDGILDMKTSTQLKYLNETPKIMEVSLQHGITVFHKELEDLLKLLKNHHST
jgi:(p)ppGpp synthase/HD superfamily hydrolase